MKKKWLVRSGELEEIVTAKGADEAIALALQIGNSTGVQPLGEITEAQQIMGDAFYKSTEAACKQCGVWCKAK